MNNKIGTFIKNMRIENNMSQNELAQLIPISRQAISKWERGVTMPDSSSMIRLSQIFELSIDELFLGEKKNDQNVQELQTASLKLYDVQNKIIKKFKKTLIFLFCVFFVLEYMHLLKIKI